MDVRKGMVFFFRVKVVVLSFAATTTNEATMATVVANKAIELAASFGQSSYDQSLVSKLGETARVRSIAGGATGWRQSLVGKDEIVGSRILSILYKHKDVLRSSSGAAHVLYAPPSMGKTTTLMYFVKNYLEKYNAPTIMISDQNPGNVDYLMCMAAALDIPSTSTTEKYGWWLASLLKALLPRKNETVRHAPVLILDEFNSPGVENQNILFAEAFSRFVYQQRISVIFVT